MAGSEAHEGIVSKHVEASSGAEEGKIKIKKRKTDQLRLRQETTVAIYIIYIFCFM